MKLTKKCILLIGFLFFLTGPALSETAPVSDTWLHAKLSTSYALNEHLNPFLIDVDVQKGVATLSGEVENRVEKSLAAEIAKSIEGITEVNNNLVVSSKAKKISKPNDFSKKFTDATMAAKVKLNLLWHRDTSGMDIEVDANGDTVTLNGTVNSGAQKDLASQLAENTSGVSKVNNKLKVDPDKKRSAFEQKMEQAEDTVSDTWLTTKVKSKLLYDRRTDGLLIDVTTKNGVVVLHGNVPSKKQKKSAINLIKNMPNVKDVRDDLKVVSDTQS